PGRAGPHAAARRRRAGPAAHPTVAPRAGKPGPPVDAARGPRWCDSSGERAPTACRGRANPRRHRRPEPRPGVRREPAPRTATARVRRPAARRGAGRRHHGTRRTVRPRPGTPAGGCAGRSAARGRRPHQVHHGREINAGHYPGGTDERETIAALKESNEKIVAAIKEAWPGIPGPEEVHTGEGELLGRVIPSAGGWTALTTFGGILAEAVSHAEAVDTLQCRGLSVLAQPWWVRLPGEEPWQVVRLMEVHAGRVRLRWADPLVEQPAAGQWFDTEDLDFAPAPPANATLGTGSGT